VKPFFLFPEEAEQDSALMNVENLAMLPRVGVGGT
jgi:hypothetical protein